jgi:hypothetical protein
VNEVWIAAAPHLFGPFCAIRWPHAATSVWCTSATVRMGNKDENNKALRLYLQTWKMIL